MSPTRRKFGDQIGSKLKTLRKRRWIADLSPCCLLAGLSGLALPAGRDTQAMGLLLPGHLGVVIALFLTLPYGKFAHSVYRSAAPLKWSIEKREPNRLQFESD